MKRLGKQIFAAAVFLLLLTVMALPCFAAGTAYAEAFIDNAGGVLKDSEVSALQTAARTAAKQVGANVGIIFTKSGLDEDDLDNRAVSLYNKNCDERSDAVILAVDVSERTCSIRWIGRMNDELTRSAKNRIENRTVEQLSENNWSGAATAFVAAVGSLTADDFSAGSGNLLIGEFIVVIVALVIGFAVAGVFAYRMNNARRGRNAANYVKDNSFALNKSADLYLFSTVTKTRVQSESSGGGRSSGGSSQSSSHSRF